MKRMLCKVVSVLLTASLLLSIASCGKKKNAKKASVVAEDTPWFDINTIDVDSGADPEKEIESVNHEFCGSDDKYLVVRSSGRYMEPPEDEIDWDNYNFESYNFSVIAVIDREKMETVNTIDLYNGLDTGLLTHEHVDTATYVDGKITVKTNSKERDYDLLTGELLDTRPSTTSDLGSSSQYYKVGDYVIDAETNWDENSRSNSYLNIKAPDGTFSKIDMNEPGKTTYVMSVLPLDDTTALVPALVNNEYVFYELDLTTNNLKEGKAKDYEWLDTSALGQALIGTDGLAYSRTESGISRINTKTKTVEEVFNYNWCGLNRAIVESYYFDLIECSADKLVFIGQTEPASMYQSEPGTFQIVEFVKADKNPHAGKTILELFDYYLDENTGAAIVKFNENNDKYYIQVCDRYKLADIFDSSAYPDYMNEDEWSRYLIDERSAMSNALAMDIINGEGPDILMNTSKYGQLNSPNCLVDLSPYVKKLDSDNYFTNIIEGSKTDGALYQLPVSFSIAGIYTDAKEAGASGVGFTLDEYQSFVKDSLNGTDIIVSGQAIYFADLFNSMNEKFIKDGKADFSGSEFEALADYVKNNVPEESTSSDDIPWQIYNYADFGTCYGIGGFYWEKSSMVKNPTILGGPSLDGRGPSFSSKCSVAISANAVNVDACAEFVKILLSDEIQTYIAMNDYFVLNRNAFRSGGEAANDYYNKGGAESAFASGRPYNNGVKYTSADIDNIERIILSCSRLQYEDPAITIILIEEMPAYFCDQKELSKVIKIAQDRAQKVLDERD